MRFRGKPAPGNEQTRSARRRRRFTLDPRGQGLVEFAISFPVVMFMIAFGVDFGRVFLGWVTLNNAVREAANFAAINPDAWTTPGSPSARAEFARLINAEAQGINCAMPATLPNPSFPNGTSIGSPSVVAITCRFSLITPIISNVLGNTINVSASASFPVRAGAIDGTPVGEGLPSFTPFVATPSPIPTDTAAPTATPVPTPSPAPTAVPTCFVPNLIDVQTSQATSRWTAAGFAANNLAFNPLVPPNYKIKHMSPWSAGQGVLCTASMTVSP